MNGACTVTADEGEGLGSARSGPEPWFDDDDDPWCGVGGGRAEGGSEGLESVINDRQVAVCGQAVRRAEAGVEGRVQHTRSSSISSITCTGLTCPSGCAAQPHRHTAPRTCRRDAGGMRVQSHTSVRVL